MFGLQIQTPTKWKLVFGAGTCDVRVTSKSIRPVSETELVRVLTLAGAHRSDVRRRLQDFFPGRKCHV